MKIILFSLLVLSGAIAKAQHTNSQASQVITMRLQPISFIDFSSVETGSQPKHADSKKEIASSARDIIMNVNVSPKAALPASAPQNEEKGNYKRALDFSVNEAEPVFTFSSR